MKLDKIGFWSEIKLEIIKEYAHAFTTIMKSQDWCKGYAYIDAFAGAGIHISRKTGEFVSGSPLNALEIKNPFTEYHYIDIDKEKIEILESLTHDRQNVHIYPGRLQRDIDKEILPSLPYRESKKRALCILDPYGLHLHWKTIMEAAKLKTTEIFLNFPLMDMNRNVLHKDLLSADPKQIERMNRFCGTEEWQDILYKEDKQMTFLLEIHIESKLLTAMLSLGIGSKRKDYKKLRDLNSYLSLCS